MSIRFAMCLLKYWSFLQFLADLWSFFETIIICFDIFV